VVSAPVRRRQVEYAHQRGLSKRSACALMNVPRSTLGYQLRQPAKDAPVLSTMRRLSAQFPRFGYRRIHVYLEREGHRMGWDRAHRLWRLAGLQVPRKRPRRRIASGRPRPLPASGANQVWAYDFVFDGCANGQQLKCLTVIDEWTRECLAIDVQGSIRSKRVIEVLSRLVSLHGAPAHVRSDNGPEFVSHAVLKWLQRSGIDTALIDPGKPWQNGADESFNGKFRDECLSAEWFRTREEARAVIEAWRLHFNGDRPHSSLGYLSPLQFKGRLQENRSMLRTISQPGAVDLN
jgi:putative transposase